MKLFIHNWSLLNAFELAFSWCREEIALGFGTEPIGNVIVSYE